MYLGVLEDGAVYKEGAEDATVGGGQVGHLVDDGARVGGAGAKDHVSAGQAWRMWQVVEES